MDVDGWSQRKRIQIPRLLCDIIDIIDVKAPVTNVRNTIY
jgi:hypothetical protein